MQQKLDTKSENAPTVYLKNDNTCISESYKTTDLSSKKLLCLSTNGSSMVHLRSRYNTVPLRPLAPLEGYCSVLPTARLVRKRRGFKGEFRTAR